VFHRKAGIHSYSLFIFTGGYDMTKDPMTGTVLPEIPRRKRKIVSEFSKTNISYKSLLELHLKQCRLKNLATVTIDGYRTASRYFLGFTGCMMMLPKTFSMNTAYICKPSINLKQSTVICLRSPPLFCLGLNKGTFLIRFNSRM